MKFKLTIIIIIFEFNKNEFIEDTLFSFVLILFLHHYIHSFFYFYTICFILLPFIHLERSTHSFQKVWFWRIGEAAMKNNSYKIWLLKVYIINLNTASKVVYFNNNLPWIQLLSPETRISKIAFKLKDFSFNFIWVILKTKVYFV